MKSRFFGVNGYDSGLYRTASSFCRVFVCFSEVCRNMKSCTCSSWSKSQNVQRISPCDDCLLRFPWFGPGHWASRPRHLRVEKNRSSFNPPAAMDPEAAIVKERQLIVAQWPTNAVPHLWVGSRLINFAGKTMEHDSFMLQSTTSLPHIPLKFVYRRFGLSRIFCRMPWLLFGNGWNALCLDDHHSGSIVWVMIIRAFDRVVRPIWRSFTLCNP